MADFASSLPMRTEANGDAAVKIVDGTTPSQELAVEADGSINVNAGLASGAKVQLTDGVEDALVSTAGELQTKDDGAIALLTTIDADTSNLDVALSTRASEATLSTVAGDTTSIDGKLVDGNDIGDVTINNAAGASAVNIQDGGNSITVDAIDLDIRNLTAVTDSVQANLFDETGAAYTALNPLPVSLEESGGDEVVDYNTASAIAKNATSNHDYTVTALKTLLLEELWCSASGKMKVEVQFETAAASGVFNTRWVGFNSTSNPNIRIPSDRIGKQVAGAIVRIIRTNLDNQAQDLYSTISGIEV